MKNVWYIIHSLIMCALLFSCSTTRKINDLELISAAYENGDILFLIDALEKYPLYRGYTESYLYDYDFSQHSYGDIKQYAIAAQNDVNTTMFFDSLLLNKQVIMIDYLSNLSIAEVGEFYRKNCIEHDYLKSVLSESYFSDVYSLDYRNRKVLYQAFKDTDLSSEIEQPYNELRDSLLTDIINTLKSYFNSEREMLSQIEEVVRYESQKYINDGIEKIITAACEKNDRGLFKKIFKREELDNYSFKAYINNVINETYDYMYIDKLTKDRVSEFITSANQLRSMLFNQYFPDYKYAYIYIPNNTLENQLVWIIGRNDVNKIQGIKNTGKALSVGSLALGLFSGIGAVAFAADVADFAYGLSQDGKINQATQQMASTIYEDSSHCIDTFLTEIFNSLSESQKSTESNIIRIFNDEF